MKLARLLGIPVEIAYVSDALDYPALTLKYKSFTDGYLKVQRARLVAISKSLSNPKKVRFLTGDPANELLSYSRKRNSCELIALGTLGRKGLDRIFLGSVA